MVNKNIYFDDPRMYHSTVGVFFVRTITYVFYITFSATTVVLLLSDISNLKWLGLIFFAFLIDRFIHWDHGKTRTQDILSGKKSKTNIIDTFSTKSMRFTQKAFVQAITMNKSLHVSLLIILLNRKRAEEIFSRMEIDTKDIIERLEKYNEKEVKQDKDKIREEMAELSKKALLVSQDINDTFIHPRSLIVAIFQTEIREIEKIKNLFNVTPEDLREAVIFDKYRAALAEISRVPATLGGFGYRSKRVRKRIMNREWTARPTNFLDEFSEDLTALARREKVGFMVGHKKEFDQLVSTISRVDKPNVVLVGEAGVGKTSVIAHLAFRIIKDEVPKNLFDKRLVSIDMNKIIADASTEKIAERLDKIKDEVLKAGNIILHIPKVHNLFKSVSGDDSSIVPIDLFMSIIQDDAIPVIGETYPLDFKNHIEERSDFLEYFEKIQVDEMSKSDTIRLLSYQSLVFEKQFKIKISLDAIRSSVSLSHRYLHQKPLPLGAINLLKNSLSRAQQEDLKILKKETVIEVAEDMSKIPIQQAESGEAKNLLNMEKLIHERLINQKTAVEAVSRHLREYRSGLSKKGGPIASFLFVGPTGVGKTELSKQLARIQFGSEKMMHRFDMSEYQDRKSVYQLIGSPDSKTRGRLTDAVNEKPYSLILLDEIEKAHPDVLNIFLQVLDDGRLTNNLGKTIEFENTIIIATSNAHSDFIKKEVEEGKSATEISEEIKTKLSDIFRPEFLNRFSDIIVFRNLNTEEIQKIVGIMIVDLIDQVEKSQGIEVSVSNEVIKKIAELGYSSVYGARPLNKVISESIRGVLAERILSKEIGRGNKVEVVYENEEIKVIVKK